MNGIRVACALIATVAVSTGLLAATASASQYKECGTFGTAGVVKAHNTSCREAQKVMPAVLGQVPGPGSPLTVDGFACKGRFHHGRFEVTCNKAGGKKLVRWRGQMGRRAPERVTTARLTDCGTINVPDEPRDARVLAHKVRCKAARRAGKYFVANGPKPGGHCSASIGRCYNGGFDSNRWITLKWA